MLDIQSNSGRIGLTNATTYSYFLIVSDAISTFAVMLGLASLSSAEIFEALLHSFIWSQPKATFYAW